MILVSRTANTLLYNGGWVSIGYSKVFRHSAMRHQTLQVLISLRFQSMYKNDQPAFVA